MKKEYIIYIVVVAVLFLIYKSCRPSISSGSKILDLEVRVITEPCSSDNPKVLQYCEQFANLFTVLPGPHELIWESSGDSNFLTTKLKIRIRRNNTNVKLVSDSWSPEDREEMIRSFIDHYDVKMFNSDGKLKSEVISENKYDESKLFFDIRNRNNPMFSSELEKEAADHKYDFYDFLTSAPGTEFDLIFYLYDTYYKTIDDMIDYNKGFFFYINPPEPDENSDLLK